MHIQWRHLEVRVSDKQHSSHLKECFIDIQTYTTEQNISVFVHSPKPGLHWSLFISSHRQELDKANSFASVLTLEQEEKPSLRSQTAAFHKCIATSTRTGESVCVSRVTGLQITTSGQTFIFIPCFWRTEVRQQVLFNIGNFIQLMANDYIQKQNKKKTDRKLRKRGNSAKSREHIQMDWLSSHFQPHLSV